MRHLAISVTAIAAIALACGSAGAGMWVEMNVSNGDFSTPGTYPLGSSVSIPSLNGTADNGKLFDDWKVGGNALSGAGYSLADGSAEVYRAAANGKNQTPTLVHDSLTTLTGAYYTVAATKYKLEFDARYGSYAYKAYAGLLYGDTNISDSSTWKLGSYFTSGGPYQMVEWSIGLTGSMQTFSYEWDNSVAPVRVGEHIRIAFNSSQYGTTTSAALYVDNVKLYQWVEEPVLFADPATEYTIDFGTLDVAEAGASRTVTLRNDGVAASLLDILSVYGTTADTGLFTLVGNVPTSLAGGESAQYSIGFGGSFTTGLKTTDLVFVTSAGNVTYHLRAQVGDIPEPATMALVVVGGLAVLVRRKRN